MSIILQTFADKFTFISFVHPVTGEVWTKGNDVAELLGYDEPSRAIDTHIKNDKFKQRWHDIAHCFTFRGIPSIWQPETIMINGLGFTY